jgi:uncharacterized damage-inducible protein DinB
MTRLDEIRQLYDFNRWANGRILEAAAALAPEPFDRDLGSSFPSVRATLAHVLGAEWIWLARWNGTSPTAPPAWALGDVASLRARWAEVEAGQAVLLASLDDDRLDQAIDYRSLAGEPYRSRLWQMLRHVVNHSTYHRGQVTTMLRQLGAAAPATDLILYFRTVA